MTEEQYVYLYTIFSDTIQISCEYLLNSDFLMNFPDWNGSFLLVNEGVLKICENLGYISEHCGLDLN
jgi:hypothetical protein